MLLIGIPPSIKAGSSNPEIPARFASIADLLGVLENPKLALNVAFFVRHEIFLHPKSGNLQEVSRESVHIYNRLLTPHPPGLAYSRSFRQPISSQIKITFDAGPVLIEPWSKSGNV